MKARRFLLAVTVLVSMVVMSHSVAFAQALGIQLFAVLSGGNEVDAAGMAGAGDLSGSGSATVLLIPQSTTICFSILVTGIAPPTAAHIHRGNAGTNGGVVVPLTAPSSGNPGTASGCQNINAAVLDAIRNTPSRYYVNVHNGPFPDGALRGQLF